MITGDWTSDGLDKDGNASCLVEHWASSVLYMNHVITMDVRGGSPMNVYCSFAAHVPISNYFFQVEIPPGEMSSSLSVGVVRRSEVKKGWGTKGMFYNGNLTNGGAALKVGYGPSLKPGDVILVEYGYTDEDKKHRVRFHVNGTCLGTAFEIVDDSMNKSEIFVPCLSCQGHIEVKTQVHTTREAMFSDSYLATIARKPNPWQGDWNLVQAWKAPGSIHQQHGMTPIWPPETSQPGISEQVLRLHMEQLASQTCAMVVKVCNSMRVIKRISPSPVLETETITLPLSGPRAMEYILENLDGDGSSGVVASTKMMPPPPLFEVEQYLSQALAMDWKALRVATEGNIMHAVGCDGVVLAQFERRQHDPDQVACTSYR